MVALTRELLAQLPPSERDFDVFSEVVVASRSTREAARHFHLSQTRVCQIVERVWEWVQGVLPRIDADMTPEMLVKAAKYVASDRLNHLYSLVIRSFEMSQRDQVKRRVNAYGDETTTTTSSCGDVKYLNAALRITIAHGKSGIPMGLVPSSLAFAADDAEELLASDEWQEAESAAARAGDQVAETKPVELPPARECSPSAEYGVQDAEPQAARQSATPAEKKSSDRLTPRQKRARKSFFGPVQPAASAGVLEAVAQLKLSPDRPGASVEVLERQSA